MTDPAAMPPDTREPGRADYLYRGKPGWVPAAAVAPDPPSQPTVTAGDVARMTGAPLQAVEGWTGMAWWPRAVSPGEWLESEVVAVLRKRGLLVKERSGKGESNG